MGAAMVETERLLDPEEIAARLGLSPLTVRDMLRAGKLTGAFHLGRLWKMREEDLNKYIRKLAKGDSEPPEAHQTSYV
jgi:excisionase family DNA binding protein